VLVALRIAPVTCGLQDATHIRYDSVCETWSKPLTATTPQVKFLSVCDVDFCRTCDRPTDRPTDQLKVEPLAQQRVLWTSRMLSWWLRAEWAQKWDVGCNRVSSFLWLVCGTYLVRISSYLAQVLGAFPQFPQADAGTEPLYIYILVNASVCL
jgi:hypothetical protein